MNKAEMNGQIKVFHLYLYMVHKLDLLKCTQDEVTTHFKERTYFSSSGHKLLPLHHLVYSLVSNGSYHNLQLALLFSNRRQICNQRLM